MNNLFSIFDPMSFLGFSLNWVSSILLLLWVMNSYWLVSSGYTKLVQVSLLMFSKEISLNFGNLPSPGFSFVLSSLLMFVGLNNYYGLSPYVFTSSSHLSFSIPFSLVFWGGLMTWSVIFSSSKVIAHLVPLGTPVPLIPLMILIELISNMIRPLTLAVRLAANMVAGHLLLSLVSSSVNSVNLLCLLGFLAVGVMMVLENAVSLIQGYVFSMLPSLYIAELNFPYY